MIKKPVSCFSESFLLHLLAPRLSFVGMHYIPSITMVTKIVLVIVSVYARCRKTYSFTLVHTFQSLFTFSNFSLPYPNVMKLIQNANYHITQIKSEFWWGHFNHSKIMLLFKWKNCSIFSFLSLTLVCLSLMLWDLYIMLLTT